MKNCILRPMQLEIRAHEGGDDAKEIARLQLDIYKRLAARNGL